MTNGSTASDSVSIILRSSQVLFPNKWTICQQPGCKCTKSESLKHSKAFSQKGGQSCAPDQIQPIFKWFPMLSVGILQDPYLEYLALTGGNSFPLPASYYRTVGAILLAIGLALLLGMLSLLCCCCCLIRHAVRLNNGQPSGWATSTIYNTAQA